MKAPGLRRALLNLLTALSLVLGVAASALWASSHFIALSLHRQDDGVGRSFTSDGGVLAYQRTGRVAGDHGSFSWRLHHNRPGGWGGAHLQRPAYGRLGFGRVAALYLQTPPGVTPPAYVYIEQAWAPLWAASAALALLPACRLVWRAAANADRALARRRRRRAGLCASCGYDLRATPNRCPECGAAATEPTAA